MARSSRTVSTIPAAISRQPKNQNASLELIVPWRVVFEVDEWLRFERLQVEGRASSPCDRSVTNSGIMAIARYRKPVKSCEIEHVTVIRIEESHVRKAWSVNDPVSCRIPRLHAVFDRSCSREESVASRKCSGLDAVIADAWVTPRRHR